MAPNSIIDNSIIDNSIVQVFHLDANYEWMLHTNSNSEKNAMNQNLDTTDCKFPCSLQCENVQCMS